MERKNAYFFKTDSFLTVQTEPKNPRPAWPGLFYRERNYKDLGALLPAVLQVIINSLGQCCSVPAELMFLDNPSSLTGSQAAQ